MTSVNLSNTDCMLTDTWLKNEPSLNLHYLFKEKSWRLMDHSTDERNWGISVLNKNKPIFLAYSIRQVWSM